MRAFRTTVWGTVLILAILWLPAGAIGGPVGHALAPSPRSSPIHLLPPSAGSTTSQVLPDRMGSQPVTTSEGAGPTSTASPSRASPAGTDPLNRSIPVGTDPDAVAYDNSTGVVFVADCGSDDVRAVDPFTSQVVSEGTVGSCPSGLTYDYQTNDLFVANSFSNTVSILNASTLTPIRTLAVGTGPLGLSFDPGLGLVFVSNFDSANATVINGNTDRVVGSVSVGAYPGGIAFDAETGWMFVADTGAGEVSEFNASNTSDVVEVAVGSDPQGIDYDPGSGDIFVGTTSGLTALYGGNGSVRGELAFGNTSLGVADDPVTGEVFVTEVFQENVTVVNATRMAVVGTIPGGSGPYADVYDPWNNGLYVADSLSNNLLVLPASPTYPVILAESSLYAGTYWGIYLAPRIEWTNGTSVLFYLPNGTYTFFLLSNSSLNINGETYGTVQVDGTNVSVELDLWLVFWIIVREVGLPANVLWAVNFGINWYILDAGQDFLYEEANGSYPYRAEALSWGVPHVVVNQTGVIRVDGANGTRTVTFERAFWVNFTEEGLPLAVAWGVNLSGSLNTTTDAWLTFLEANSTDLPFEVEAPPGYQSTRPTGTIAVQGEGVNLTIRFSLVLLPVWINETGLTPGTFWGLDWGNTVTSSTNSSIELASPPGPLSYDLSPVPGYRPDPANGTFDVSSMNRSLAVTFSAVTYSLAFEETGLPPSTPWTISLSPLGPRGATSGSIVFEAANESYSFAVEGPANYTAHPASGQVTVNGSDASVAIHFSPVTKPVGPPASTAAGPFGLTPLEALGILGAAAAAGTGTVIAWTLRRARRPPGR